jgi:hypothetical protein
VTSPDDFFDMVPDGAAPVSPVYVVDHAGRRGRVVWFTTDPVGALVSWDEGGATRLTGRRFAELTAYAGPGAYQAA